ncbi:MAG: DUF4424 domain-containing protein [Allosphingosinicella sp.]
MKVTVPFAAACVSLSAAALANDTVAETAAGGLVLTRTDAVEMVSEDLFVSAAKVRVAYVFRNRTPKDVTVTVAFPMPDRDLLDESEQDTAIPAGFHTLVEGRPVAMRVETKALLNGRDVTALLSAIQAKVSGDGIGAALDRLPKADRERLLRLGLARTDEYDAGHGMETHLVPAWTVRETWYWRQVFPAGRDVHVEHSYTPGTGGSVGTMLASRQSRAEPEGRRMIADYCVDAAFLAALDRRAAATGADFPVIPEQRIGYVLTTGANWAAPIGRFRLVVDKGAADNLVSFCGDGIRKISPTRFEMVKTNWRPTRDLEVLIVEPAAKE